MKALRIGLGVFLTCGFALTASCGGSSGDDSASAGGSSSTAGTSSTSGGSSNVAGSGTTFGGSSSTNGGDTSTNGGSGTTVGGSSSTNGGSTAGGGRTGGGGTTASGGTTAAGGATNGPDCPTTAPKSGDTCTVPATLTDRCNYPGLTCRCRPQFQGPGGGQAGASATDGTFTCQGSGTACPTTAPKTGDACTGNLQCPYPSGEQCFCFNKKYQCQGGMMTGGTCPANKPANNTTACTTQGEVCNYGQGNVCVCDGAHLICGG